MRLKTLSPGASLVNPITKNEPADPSLSEDPPAITMKHRDNMANPNDPRI